MEEIRNIHNKLICRVDKAEHIVEIVIKGCKTTIRFCNDGTVEIKKRRIGVKTKNHICPQTARRQWKANFKRFLCRLFVCGKNRLCGFFKNKFKEQYDERIHLLFCRRNKEYD